MNKNLINRFYRKIEAGDCPMVTAFRFDDYLKADEDCHWAVYRVRNNHLTDHKLMSNDEFYRFITENEMHLFAYWNGCMYGENGQQKGKLSREGFLGYVKNNRLPENAPRGELKSPWPKKKEKSDG